MVFSDRVHAGRALGDRLTHLRGRSDVVVLGLPRGGVPVAAEVARTIGAPLDVFLVRKVGVPGHEELAMGAVASGGVVVRNEDVLMHAGIDDDTFERVVDAECAELERRERVYRPQGREAVDLVGRAVVLVDDGLATGSTMRAAIRAVRDRDPSSVTVAIPVAPASTVAALAHEADDVVCIATPQPFLSVGSAYRVFTQTTDDEVIALLSGESGVS